MKNCYTKCWKCEENIITREDCNYLKIRDGNYSLCNACYEFFLNHNSIILRPELSRQEELKRSFLIAIEDFHRKMFDAQCPIYRNGSSLKGGDSLPTTLIHTVGWWSDCDVCSEILKMRCPEH